MCVCILIHYFQNHNYLEITNCTAKSCDSLPTTADNSVETTKQNVHFFSILAYISYFPAPFPLSVLSSVRYLSRKPYFRKKKN